VTVLALSAAIRRSTLSVALLRFCIPLPNSVLLARSLGDLRPILPFCGSRGFQEIMNRTVYNVHATFSPSSCTISRNGRPRRRMSSINSPYDSRGEQPVGRSQNRRGVSRTNGWDSIARALSRTRGWPTSENPKPQRDPQGDCCLELNCSLKSACPGQPTPVGNRTLLAFYRSHEYWREDRARWTVAAMR
jgi:hypothetical protein